MIVIVLTAILAAVAGGIGGLVGVRVGRELGHRDLAHVFQNVSAAAKRANQAASVVEAAEIEVLLNRVEKFRQVAQRGITRADTSEDRVNEVVRRQAALEQAIAANLSIHLMQ